MWGARVNTDVKKKKKLVKNYLWAEGDSIGAPFSGRDSAGNNRLKILHDLGNVTGWVNFDN